MKHKPKNQNYLFPLFPEHPKFFPSGSISTTACTQSGAQSRCDSMRTPLLPPHFSIPRSTHLNPFHPPHGRGVRGRRSWRHLVGRFANFPLHWKPWR
ncbi:hypothetical protein CDAR_519691 [Caerostris darwini]|uniref:Uncharacterized protein n=1 Tax=Caerostris darwini TaxID=1538125 RepID=A0AAV4RDE4_9ARAC|nr:hypothetical protein CDAR_519691 [Caerostris darwini]